MKTSIIYILSFLTITFSQIVFCQNGEIRESKYSLAASLGINDYHQRDKYLSPYIFNGSNFASKLSFLIESENSNHIMDAFFSYGALNSDIQPRYVRQHVASLSYSYAHSIAATEFAGRPLQFSAGGGISSLLLYTDLNTTDETNYTKYDQSWYWSHSANIALSGGFELDENKKLNIRITTPVIALISRPENERWMSQKNSEVSDNYFEAATQGRVEYFWNNLVLFTDIEYRQSISDNFDILAAYRFGYISSSRPASILAMGMYMNNLTIGVAWSL